VTSAPRSSPIDPLSLKHIGSQLVLELGGPALPSWPSWESLPEGARAEALVVLARLLVRAGLEEESGA
jgi:hypothetical protein